MKKHYLILLLLIIIIGCKKKCPFLSKEEIEQLFPPDANVGNVAIIFNNDIYFFPTSILTTPEQITNTSSIVKSMVKVSHHHDRFAYINGTTNTIEIVNRQGGVVDQITSYVNPQQFDWCNNDSTLYILLDNHVYYYGPSIIPTIPYTPPSISYFITTMSYSKDNDLAYIEKKWDFTNGTTYDLMIKYNTGGQMVINLINEPTLEMAYVNFDINGKDFVVGYNEVTSPANELRRVELYKNLSNTPFLTLESSERFCSPHYRSDLKYIVSGFKDVNSNNYKLFRRNISNGNEISNSTYNSNNNQLYVDWK